MPNRLAIAAAVVTALAVSACGSAQWQASSAPQGSDGAGQASETLPGDSELRIGALDPGSTGNPGEFGLPPASGASIDDVLRLGAVATWVDAPDELAISLPATDECWPTAGEPTVVSPNRISVTFAMDAVCQAPDAARTYTLQVPPAVDTSADLEVVVEGLPDRVTLTLPAT